MFLANTRSGRLARWRTSPKYGVLVQEESIWSVGFSFVYMALKLMNCQDTLKKNGAKYSMLKNRKKFMKALKDPEFGNSHSREPDFPKSG
jgi:hypothetical protein